MPSSQQIIGNKLSGFGLSDEDIVWLGLYYASVMLSLGKKLLFIHTICFLHTLNLVISDVLYKKSKPVSDEQIESINVINDIEAGILISQVDSDEFEFNALDFQSVCVLIRKIVKYFKVILFLLKTLINFINP